jgi:hypothetical protein
MKYVMEQVQRIYSNCGIERIANEEVLIEAYIAVSDIRTGERVATRHIVLPDLPTYFTNHRVSCSLQELDDCIREFQLRYMWQWRCCLHIVQHINDWEDYELESDAIANVWTISQTENGVLCI